MSDLEKFLLVRESMVTGNEAKFQKKAYQIALDHVRRGDDLSDLDIRKIPGLGERMVQRILFFYGRANPVDERDTIAMENAFSEDVLEKEETISLFLSIEGVGPVTAEKWFQAGYRTIEDLTNFPPVGITAKQRDGIKYHSSLIERIPREEIDFFQDELLTTVGDISFTIAGSYRRGKETSGDIDIIVLLEEGREKEIRERMFGAIHFLSLLASGEKKINGIAEVAGKARRVDIEFTIAEQYPYALLYFTGSKDFNREMRGIANEKGYHLDEKYLSTPYRVWGDQGKTKYLRNRLKFYKKIDLNTDYTRYLGNLSEKEKIFFERTGNLYLVLVESEEEVFDLLDMEWKNPKER